MNTAKLDAALEWAGARLREASTYNGLGTLLGAAVLFHFLPAADVGPIVKDVTMLGMSLGGLLGVVIPEGK